MKSNNKINTKKAMIVFPIIIVMVGTILMGAISPILSSQNNVNFETSSIGKNIEDIIKDERILKIFDIHENLPEYLEKDITLEGYFIKLDDNTDVFGLEIPLEGGKVSMASLSYELSNPDLLKDITETTLVKASGKIGSFDELHEDESQGDHTHTLPKFHITGVEVLR